jgi:hypothetical protein
MHKLPTALLAVSLALSPVAYGQQTASPSVVSSGASMGLATNIGPSVAINAGPPVAVR